MVRCLGPLASAVMNGRLMSVDMVLESSTFAFSAASRTRCMAIVSFFRSMPVWRMNSLTDVVDEGVVHVRAAQLGVPAGGNDLEPALLPHLHDRDVQRAAAEVEHEDLQLLAGLLQAVGQTRRGGLVDDAQHLQARDLAGILGGRALVVVEVRGAGDDHLFHGVPEVRLRVLLDLLQDERRDLLGAVLLAEELELVVRPHLALGRVDGAVGVDGRLPARGLSHQPLSLLGEGHERRERFARRDPAPSADGMIVGPAALHDRGGRVGSPQVDSDDSCHMFSPLLLSRGFHRARGSSAAVPPGKITLRFC